MRAFLNAVAFLTVIPVRLKTPSLPAELGRSAFWFPLVGLLMGGLLSVFYAAVTTFFPPMFAAALTVAFWAAMTGGLHLDGVADCCDGMLAALPPERRLEIMKDPRLGTFGGVGLVLFLLLKIFALASLPQDRLMPALLAAPAVGRWLLLVVARQPQARPGGMGAAFASLITPRVVIFAMIWPLSVLIFGGWHGLLAFAVSCLAVGCVVRLARARLGGVTGDVFGLSIETAELVVLAAFCVLLPALV